MLLLGTGGIIAIVVVAVVVLFLIWWISTSNGFITLKNQAEEAWATIDVFLKKRYDLIPNLVETVKGYAKHESDTLKGVVEARNTAVRATTPEEKMAAAKEMSSSLRTLLNAVHENYPELKANTNFLDLQTQLKGLEGELEKARRYYNGVCKSFNTSIQLFPGRLVANAKHYTKLTYFELDSEEERKNVKVQF